MTAFMVAPTKSAGTNANATSIPPSHGANGNTTTVLMITAKIAPGMNPHFLLSFMHSAIEMAANAIANAIGM